MVKQDLYLYGGGALFLLLFGRRIVQFLAKQTVSLAVDLPASVAVGTGKAVGIPETDMTQCQKDIVAGKTWDASFSCPASDFASALINDKFGKPL